MYKRPESVLVVIVARSGEVLLMQRADAPDFWQSVTGSLEQGELPPQTAVRELSEETGLTLQPGQLIDLQTSVRYLIPEIWLHRYAPDVNENLEHWFAAILPEPQTVQLQPQEHLSYHWVSFAQAQQQLTSASNREALYQVQRLLEQAADA